MRDLYDVNLKFSLPIHETSNYSFDKSSVISTQSFNGDIAIASNDGVLLLSDNGTDVSHCLNLDCSVEVMQWSSDGKFLGLADAAGCIHIISKENFKSILCESLAVGYIQQDEKMQPCFCSISFTCRKGLYTLIVSSANAKVFVLEAVDLALIQSGKESKTFSNHSKVIDALTCHEEALCCHTVFDCFYETVLYTSGYGNNSIALWNVSSSCWNSADLDEYAVVVKRNNVQVVTDCNSFTAFTKLKQIQSFVFAICNNGYLYQFSLPHFILVKFWSNFCLLDFLVKMPNSLSTFEGRSMCKVYGLKKIENENHVCVFSWETMNEIFSVACGLDSVLIDAPSNVDDIFYISETTEKSSEINLGIMKLSESSPAARLNILLQHYNYKEAAQFALKYNLDVQPVFQHEATYLLQMISSLTDDELVKKTFGQFKQCISKITDALFVGELCTTCSLNNISIYYELLKIAREYLDRGGRPYRASISDDSSDYMDLSLEVDRLLDLLVTFRMTFASDDAGLWQHFQTTNLSAQVASLLASGELQAVKMICSRHENSLIADLEKGGEKQFRNLLHIISDDADVNELVAWLELIIPAFLTSSIPNAVEILTEWLCNRAVSMEELARNWPDDAIKLANVFFKVQRKLSTVGFVRDQLSSTFYIFNDTEGVAKLKLLTSRLQILKSLRTRYGCHVSLDELIQETTLTLIFRMLDKVTAPELIAKCLDNTVRPYMREHKLYKDDTLLLYVKELLGASDKISGQFRSLRQRKVIAIIKCLKDEKVLVESTVLLAKKASIPWSNNMRQLVETALDVTESPASLQNLMDDELKSRFDSWKSQLAHCVHLEKIPAIAAKYDIGIISHSKLVNHEMLVRRIVKDERADSLEDAEKIAKIFSNKPKEIVYFYRIHHLIEQQKIAECLEILDEHPDISAQLAKRVFWRTTVVLSCPESMWSQSRLDHCLACIAMMEHVLHHSKHYCFNLIENWNEDIRLIKNIYNLQTRYGEFLSVENFDDVAFKHSLLSRHVVKYYMNKSTSASAPVVMQSQVMESSTFENSSFNESSIAQQQDIGASGDNKKKDESFSSLIDLARLLDIPTEDMMAEIALKAAKTGQAMAAIELCKDLCHSRPSTKTTEIIQEIALTLLYQLEDKPEVICLYIDDICELVSIATVHCKEAKLQDFVTLHNLCVLSRDVIHGTDLSARDFISKCVESGVNLHKDVYQDVGWLNNWYVESDVLTLQSTTILPLLSQIIQLVFDKKGTSLVTSQPKSSPDKKLDDLVSCLVKTTSFLQESHRITASLQWLSAVENVLTAHLSNSKTLSTDPKCKETLQRITNQAKYAYAKKKTQMETLLTKIFLSRRIDSPYAVALLLAISEDTAFNILNSVFEANGRNFTKMIVSVGGFLLASKQWKKKCLLTLLKNPNVTGNVLVEYCSDFAFDCDAALLQYISVLLSDETCGSAGFDSGDVNKLGVVEYGKFSTLVSSSGHHVTGSSYKPCSASKQPIKRSWNKIKDELKWVSRNFDDVTELIQQIERCLVNNMSPYDYDEVDYVLQLLQDISPKDESCSKKMQFYEKARQLINYLRFVKRDCPPSEVEKLRRWRRDTPADVSTEKLPPLAQTNLPLHPLVYGDVLMAWKVLSAEANERTAEYLVPIVHLLHLDEDKFYMIATQNAIAMITGKENKVQANKQQLARLRSLIEKISCTKKAVAMAKGISEILPIGQEKVDAYEWCLTLILQWRDSLPKESSEHELVSNAHLTLTRAFKQASCELALVKHNCDSPDVLKLLNQPESLIDKLYQHPTICSRFHNPGDSYPDIHSSVDEIASIFELDGVMMRLKLIVDLLLSAGTSNTDTEDDDSTINLERLRSAALLNSTDNEAEESELIRLLYLLTYDDPDQQGKYLMKVIGNHQDGRVTNSCRVRALQCLFRIINDDQKLLALTNQTADKLRSDLRILIYMTELEKANFNVPVSHLRQPDKSSVAKSVLASSACQRSPVALRAAAEMCREFGNASSNMWVLLLQQLVALKQVPYLRHLLPDICRIPSVLSLPCLPSVWQSCVTLPIVSLTPPLDETQMNAAISSYHFLIRCPVLLKIDLPAVGKHFHSLGLHALALACLLISPGEVDNARELATLSFREIQSQLAQLHTVDQHLPGYNMILKFLQRIESM